MNAETILPDALERSNFPVDEGTAPTSPANSASHDDAPWERDTQTPWKRELLTLFMRNQLRIAPTMPILTFMLAFTASNAMHLIAPHRPDSYFGVALLLFVAAFALRFADVLIQKRRHRRAEFDAAG